MAVQTTEEFKNGGATSYAITIEYLKASDIKVRIGGTLQTYVASNPSSGEYTVSGTTVTLGAQAASGTGNVHIYRETDVDTAAAVFAAGSSIRATDLNAIHDMARMGVAEARSLIINADIRDDAVTTTKIKDLNVTRPKIANDAIDGTKIADDAVDSEHLVADSIDTEHYAPGSVDNTALGADSVTGAKIADDQINSEHYIAGSIDHEHLANDIIDGDNIQNDVINSEHYVAGSIDHEHLSNDCVDGDNIQDNSINSEHYVDGSIDHVHLANDIIDGDNIQNDVINSEHYVAGSIDHEHLSNDCVDEDNIQDDSIRAEHIKENEVTDSEIATGTLDNRYYTEAELNGGQLNSLYFTESEILGGAADSRYYTETELNAGQLDNRYFTETELTGGALDGRYYTETEAEARFLRQDSSETIASGQTWSNSDAFVATTAAINARIIDLIDEVGGFTAIANQTSFPATNPQGATGQSAILSIAATTATLTPSNGTITIPNGAGTGNTVTITGAPTIPQNFGFLVESTTTTHTYSFHRLVPIATQVNTVASNITNIVNAGANVVDINNFADLYQISNSAPTQRADGTSLQDGDLWFDNSNDNLRVYDGTNWAIITPAQSVLDDIAIVSGAVTYSEDLGLITDAASTGSSNGSLDIVADALEDEITFAVTVVNSSGNKYVIDGDTSNPAKSLTLHKGWTYTFDQSDSSNANHPLVFKTDSGAYTTNVTVTGTAGQAGAKVQIVIPETQPTGNFRYYCSVHGNAMGNTITVVEDPIKAVADIASSVVTVGGIASNVTAVANNTSNINAVQANATNINAVQANASNINAAVSNASNINAVVSNATNINTVAGNNSNITTVANNTSNINSAVSNQSNINAAVSNATNINTVSGSIADVNRYANEYQISSSAPGSPSAGDLWFDTSTNTLKNYNGSAWLGITSNSGIQNVADDTTPELAAALDCNNFNLTEVGTVSGNNLQIDFGTL